VVCAAATCAPGTVRLIGRAGSDRAGCLKQAEGLLRSVLRLPVQTARQLRRPVRRASAAAARISVYHLVGRASVDHIRAPDYHLDASYDHVYASHHDDAAQASPDGQPSSRARLITFASSPLYRCTAQSLYTRSTLLCYDREQSEIRNASRAALYTGIAHLRCPALTPQISSLSWRVRTSLASSADST